MKHAWCPIIGLVLLSACGNVPSPLASAGSSHHDPVPPSPTPTAALPILTDSDASTDGLFFGLFRESGNRKLLPAQIAGDLRRKPASVMWFQAWGGETPFPTKDVVALQQQGVLPHITWEPWDTSLALNDPNQITLDKIVAGQYDAYVSTWAKAAAATQKPLLLRWGHEFNGNWYPWAVSQNGNDPQKYIRAYRHIHDLFKSAGASNVGWIWAYNNDSVPNESWNAVAAAYPGDAYVDWVGIDGYNWGTNPSWGSWRTPRDLFGGAYAQARQVAPGKPILLAEFASSEVGGNKPAWIDDFFQTLPTSFPAIRAFTWFDLQKEEDWRVNSTLMSMERFIVGLRQKTIRSNGMAMAQVPANTKAAPPTLPANASIVADFETLAGGRPTSRAGGKVFLSGFQQDPAHPVSFSNQDAGAEPAPLVLPASSGGTQHVAFDYTVPTPNQYAGVVLTVELQPRGAAGRVSSDQSAYKTLHLDLGGTGASRVRLELIGDSSLGIADGSYPQLYVNLPASATAVEVPLSSFVQPDWAPTKVDTAEVLKHLVSIQLVVDQLPASGRVELDNLALLP